MPNLAEVTSLLSKVANAASLLTPMAGMLGIGDKIPNLIGSAIDIGKNVLDRINDGQIVADATTKEELTDVIARLEAQNAELDDYIRNS